MFKKIVMVGSLTVLPATNFISNFHNHDDVIASLVAEGKTLTLATSYGIKSGNKCICAESQDGRGPPSGSCQDDLSRSGAGCHTVPKRDKFIFVKYSGLRYLIHLCQWIALQSYLVAAQ